MNEVKEKKVQTSLDIQTKEALESFLSKSSGEEIISFWKQCLTRRGLEQIAKTHPKALVYLPKEVWEESRAQLSEILIKNPYLLEFVPPFVQGCKDTVSLLVEKNGLCLQFASEALREDPDVIALALKNNNEAFIFVLPLHIKNKDIVLMGLKEKVTPLRIISRLDASLLNDAEIFYSCALRSESVFNFIGCTLRDRVRDELNRMPALKRTGALYYLWQEQKSAEQKRFLESLCPVKKSSKKNALRRL